MGKHYTTESWVKLAKERWNYDYDYSKVEYKGSKEKVCIVCNELDEDGNVHGEFWQEANSHLYHGKRCPKCQGCSKKTTEQFIEEANNVHFNKYDYSKTEYVHSHKLVTIICPKHGEFQQTPNSHLSGKGCPRCILKSQTMIFETLKLDFPELTFIWEYKSEWLGNQRIDIFVPEYKIAIEYNGAQHYKPVDIFGGKDQLVIQVEQDYLKMEKCKQNNVELLTIRYDNQEEDLNKVKDRLKTCIKIPISVD